MSKTPGLTRPQALGMLAVADSGSAGGVPA